MYVKCVGGGEGLIMHSIVGGGSDRMPDILIGTLEEVFVA